MTFKELKFRTWQVNGLGGQPDIQARTEINGFDVSVVRNGLSYGGKKGLYEMGLFDEGGMCDPLGWGDTVKGWLRPQDVDQIFEELKPL